MPNHPRSVAEVDSFIPMLRAACEDPTMNRTLEKLLSQPDPRRRDMVRWLVDDMTAQRAPATLVQAVACLMDDTVAEQAYAVIYACPR